MAGWEWAVLWEGECVLLTEAFITLAAGTSGGGVVQLRGVGLVRILTEVTGLNCGLLKCCVLPLALFYLLLPAEYVPVETREPLGKFQQTSTIL